MALSSKEIKKLTDEDLVEKIVQTGNTDLFGELYDRYSDKVFRKIISMLKNQEESRDLTHDILIKTFLSLSKYERKAKFSTWLYMITYNGCIDYIRKKKIIVSDESIQIEEKLNEFDYDESLEIDLARLEEILELIPVEDKTILLMFYQDEMSIKELQDYFEVGESAVKMRLLRARNKLKSMYNQKYKEYGIK
jgi:RNA polymerase sigma-70 factor (ECF subfamily)